MNTLLRDFRLGLRTLLHQPLFTSAAVLVLALGIGANTALFSLIDAVLLRALSFPRADQLVVLLDREDNRVLASACLPDYQDWRATQRSLTDIALVRRDRFNLSARGQVPERVLGATITGNYFDVLQVRPALGRNFTDKEDAPGGPAAVLLVVAQVALAVVLLAGAGLLFRSFWVARNEPLGFRPDGLLTANLSLPRSRYDSKEKQAAFFAELLVRLRALPGVAAAALGDTVPFGGSQSDGGFHLTGTPPAPPGKDPEAKMGAVSPGYFAAMGMPLLRGHDFGPQDHLKQPASILIDDFFARRYFPGQDPVGQHIDAADKNAPPRTIIGVVPHVRMAAPGEQSVTENMVQMYFCTTQTPGPGMTLLVRASSGKPLDLIASVRHAVQSLDPDLPLSQVQTMEESVTADFVAQRSTVTLLGAFAGAALVLASIGLYGVMALSVTQRTRELGIRMALGSPRAAVLRLVMGQGAALVGIGLAVGLSAALVSGRLLSSVLYGVSGADPATLATVSLVLGTAALLACLLPARRASRIDPMTALRDE